MNKESIVPLGLGIDGITIPGSIGIWKLEVEERFFFFFSRETLEEKEELTGEDSR